MLVVDAVVLLHEMYIEKLNKLLLSLQLLYCYVMEIQCLRHKRRIGGTLCLKQVTQSFL